MNADTRNADARPRRFGLTRTIFWNLLIFFVLFNVLYWLLPAVSSLLRAKARSAEANRTLPPNYSGAETAWAAQHFRELAAKENVYKSYVGWHTAPVAGETINVGGPYNQRRTETTGTAAAPTVYFFGGSTMWGSGANDAGTIPSQFSAITGLNAENFGEIGWNAHQGLMQLVRLIGDGRRPDLVVFYDGVNDTHQKCRIELTPDAHERERQFDTVLRRSLNADSFAHYLAPLEKFAQNVKREINRGLKTDEYDCHADPKKAEAVAESLLRDWGLARQIVEANGGKFIGILQPVAYLNRTRLDHIPRLGLPADKGEQFRAVYPLFKAKMAGRPELHDLVSVLDRDEYLYFDFCHLSPNGNRYVAQGIAEIVAPFGLKRPAEREPAR